jgi:methylenetetrahydrofolate reductase (NADPH)
MKVIEHIANAKNPLFSYELLPPPRGTDTQQLLAIIEKLKPFSPPWINVTSHASSLVYVESANGLFRKQIYKKRPGTISVCGIIQNKFGIDAVAHVLCQGFSKEETENALIELNYLGIENVLALKGDNLNYDKNIAKEKSVNEHASQLVQQIKAMQHGTFLDGTEYNPLNFSIGVAGYPEKHIEAANMDIDIAYLHQKVLAGADYIVTQMFFDNKHYYAFVKKCRERGINIPIIPGIKVIRSIKQIQSLPKLFNIDLPHELVHELQENPNHAEEIGKNWAYKQIQDLLLNGVGYVHFFLMNDVDNVAAILKQFV